MAIEKIACPRLNRGNMTYAEPKKEVVVLFEDSDIAELPKPYAIMCDKYDGTNGFCEVDNCFCTFNDWKNIKR
ncbi:hypothetical protein KAT24_01770 [Candidatus Pacearchaeota archaeon]|nr:hypothetical protein [Candidatus Pacearchaeota archaeon]